MILSKNKLSSKNKSFLSAFILLAVLGSASAFPSFSFAMDPEEDSKPSASAACAPALPYPQDRASHIQGLLGIFRDPGVSEEERKQAGHGLLFEEKKYVENWSASQKYEAFILDQVLDVIEDTRIPFPTRIIYANAFLGIKEEGTFFSLLERSFYERSPSSERVSSFLLPLLSQPHDLISAERRVKMLRGLVKFAPREKAQEAGTLLLSQDHLSVEEVFSISTEILHTMYCEDYLLPMRTLLSLIRDLSNPLSLDKRVNAARMIGSPSSYYSSNDPKNIGELRDIKRQTALFLLELSQSPNLSATQQLDIVHASIFSENLVEESHAALLSLAQADNDLDLDRRLTAVKTVIWKGTETQRGMAYGFLNTFPPEGSESLLARPAFLDFIREEFYNRWGHASHFSRRLFATRFLAPFIENTNLPSSRRVEFFTILTSHRWSSHYDALALFVEQAFLSLMGDPGVSCAEKAQIFGSAIEPFGYNEHLDFQDRLRSRFLPLAENSEFSTKDRLGVLSYFLKRSSHGGPFPELLQRQIATAYEILSALISDETTASSIPFNVRVEYAKAIFQRKNTDLTVKVLPSLLAIGQNDTALASQRLEALKQVLQAFYYDIRWTPDPYIKAVSDRSGPDLALKASASLLTLGQNTSLSISERLEALKDVFRFSPKSFPQRAEAFRVFAGLFRDPQVFLPHKAYLRDVEVSVRGWNIDEQEKQEKSDLITFVYGHSDYPLEDVSVYEDTPTEAINAALAQKLSSSYKDLTEWKLDSIVGYISSQRGTPALRNILLAIIGDSQTSIAISTRIRFLENNFLSHNHHHQEDRPQDERASGLLWDLLQQERPSGNNHHHMYNYIRIVEKGSKDHASQALSRLEALSQNAILSMENRQSCAHVIIRYADHHGFDKSKAIAVLESFTKDTSSLPLEERINNLREFARDSALPSEKRQEAAAQLLDLAKDPAVSHDTRIRIYDGLARNKDISSSMQQEATAQLLSLAKDPTVSNAARIEICLDPFQQWHGDRIKYTAAHTDEYLELLLLLCETSEDLSARTQLKAAEQFFYSSPSDESKVLPYRQRAFEVLFPLSENPGAISLEDRLRILRRLDMGATDAQIGRGLAVLQSIAQSPTTPLDSRILCVQIIASLAKSKFSSQKMESLNMLLSLGEEESRSPDERIQIARTFLSYYVEQYGVTEDQKTRASATLKACFSKKLEDAQKPEASSQSRFAIAKLILDPSGGHGLGRGNASNDHRSQARKVLSSYYDQQLAYAEETKTDVYEKFRVAQDLLKPEPWKIESVPSIERYRFRARKLVGLYYEDQLKKAQKLDTPLVERFTCARLILQGEYWQNGIATEAHKERARAVLASYYDGLLETAEKSDASVGERVRAIGEISSLDPWRAGVATDEQRGRVRILVEAYFENQLTILKNLHASLQDRIDALKSVLEGSVLDPEGGYWAGNRNHEEYRKAGLASETQIAAARDQILPFLEQWAQLPVPNTIFLAYRLCQGSPFQKEAACQYVLKMWTANPSLGSQMKNDVTDLISRYGTDAQKVHSNCLSNNVPWSDELEAAVNTWASVILKNPRENILSLVKRLTQEEQACAAKLAQEEQARANLDSYYNGLLEPAEKPGASVDQRLRVIRQISSSDPWRSGAATEAQKRRVRALVEAYFEDHLTILKNPDAPLKDRIHALETVLGSSIIYHGYSEDKAGKPSEVQIATARDQMLPLLEQWNRLSFSQIINLARRVCDQGSADQKEAACRYVLSMWTPNPTAVNSGTVEHIKDLVLNHGTDTQKVQFHCIASKVPFSPALEAVVKPRASLILKYRNISRSVAGLAQDCEKYGLVMQLLDQDLSDKSAEASISLTPYAEVLKEIEAWINRSIAQDERAAVLKSSKDVSSDDFLAQDHLSLAYTFMRENHPQETTLWIEEFVRYSQMASTDKNIRYATRCFEGLKGGIDSRIDAAFEATGASSQEDSQ